MTTPRLDPDDFARFFRAVHAEDPFPWQERLARRVLEEGWPPALDVPTGAGKTACIDMAIFHLALEATKGLKRRAPVRIAFVVDRRLVVDEAHHRARKIASALRESTEGVLSRMSARLRFLAEDGKPPLVVARLRGGAPKEPDWIRTPSQPAVVVSTVDQVGSRLFFRGYGVSDSMKPVHAGLLGADALFLLDEAHLSQPFLQSLRESRVFQQSAPWSEDAAPAPFAVVSLSATQTGKEVAPVLLKTDDRRHPILGKRLVAAKPVELVSTTEEVGAKAWIAECVARSWALSTLGGGSARIIAVVLNRVGRARAVYDALVQRLGDESPADAALLIGPSRPLERDALVTELLPRVAARRDDVPGDRPLFIVATQCIEAGADLDFDALLTEIAPLDCLRQRFGRLNRTGRPIQARGVVLATPEQIGGRAEPDAIYGRAPAATWAALVSTSESRGAGKAKTRWLDFGIEASRGWLPEGDELLECLAPREDAPVMMPAFIEQWANTSPIPAADPEVALFLHGPRAGPPDVQIVWRADLTEGAPELWRERAAVCPPSTLESVAVPFHAARAWLRTGRPADVPDVDFSPSVDDAAGTRQQRRALRWRGPEDDQTRPIGPEQVRPGDLLVVPSQYGGCDHWGWAPSAMDHVRDLGTEANRRHRGLEVLRLNPEIVALAWREERVEEGESLVRASKARELLVSLQDALDGEVGEALLSDDAVPVSWRQLIAIHPRKWRLQRDSFGTPLALVRRVVPEEATGHAATEDDLGSKSVSAVPLAAHSPGVRDVARRFAQQLALPTEVVNDLALAAFLHDAGKAHPDFKRWLYDGDELAAIGGADLAKSGRRLGPGSRERAGLPVGARHEVASLSFAVAHPLLQEARDPELVLWLIGTHHGHGRPFFPPVEWPQPGSTFSTDLGGGVVTSEKAPDLAALTSRWLDIQARLARKFGAWGLARLEAVVRLADHRRSESEQEER